MKPNIQRKRLAMAVAIVVVLAAVVPITGLAVEGASEPLSQAATNGGIRAADVVNGVDAQEMLSRIEALAQSGQGQLPAYFEKEIGLLEGARDARANDTGRVVGYLVDDTSCETLDRIRENMGQAGWSEVSLGQAEGATFMKEDGRCPWALVTCTQVGSATAVVFRCLVR